MLTAGIATARGTRPEFMDYYAHTSVSAAAAQRFIATRDTAHKLCPRQQEFSLPLYSWYPSRVKRRWEQLARTSRPDIAGYATYPAVNWFTFYSLRRELQGRGFECFDRFDAIDVTRRGRLAAAVVCSMRTVSALRWLRHVATLATMVVALKTRERTGHP